MATQPDLAEVETMPHAVLREQVCCDLRGDFIVLDTPYILQDGHSLRVVMEWDKKGLTVNDGGFVKRQLETFSRTPQMLRERLQDAGSIANELSLSWDEEFSYRADDLESAIRRLAVLARGVDRTLALLRYRPPRVARDVRAKLKLALVEEYGLTVTSRARPEVKGGMRPVVVDQLVRSNGHQAAVEVLSAKTDSGAAIAVDRAVTNFHVLEHFDYAGEMVAVYDTGSPASSSDMKSRFQNAAPGGVILLADSDAAGRIFDRLAG